MTDERRERKNGKSTVDGLRVIFMSREMNLLEGQRFRVEGEEMPCEEKEKDFVGRTPFHIDDVHFFHCIVIQRQQTRGVR